MAERDGVHVGDCGWRRLRWAVRCPGFQLGQHPRHRLSVLGHRTRQHLADLLDIGTAGLEDETQMRLLETAGRDRAGVDQLLTPGQQRRQRGIRVVGIVDGIQIGHQNTKSPPDVITLHHLLRQLEQRELLRCRARHWPAHPETLPQQPPG